MCRGPRVRSLEKRFERQPEGDVISPIYISNREPPPHTVIISPCFSPPALPTCLHPLLSFPLQVLNGAMLYWPMPNVLYVEGYGLDSERRLSMHGNKYYMRVYINVHPMHAAFVLAAGVQKR